MCDGSAHSSGCVVNGYGCLLTLLLVHTLCTSVPGHRVVTLLCLPEPMIVILSSTTINLLCTYTIAEACREHCSNTGAEFHQLLAESHYLLQLHHSLSFNIVTCVSVPLFLDKCLCVCLLLTGFPPTSPWVLRPYTDM